MRHYTAIGGESGDWHIAHLVDDRILEDVDSSLCALGDDVGENQRDGLSLVCRMRQALYVLCRQRLRFSLGVEVLDRQSRFTRILCT